MTATITADSIREFEIKSNPRVNGILYMKVVGHETGQHWFRIRTEDLARVFLGLADVIQRRAPELQIAEANDEPWQEWAPSTAALLN